MTDSQQLLKEYVESGSELAFRELVNRYVNLVYSTALRLVNGDTQLAEDVSQIVFIGLARKAGGLSREVMLGGWLYHNAYHIATKAARQEHRRQAREREAVEMNALNNEPEEIARRVKPLLDVALMQLSKEDRKAILLRFFEERDFRSVGTVLNVSEDAARMRVSRAVDKLHSILTRNGMALPAAALGAALGIEGAKAAPAGVATRIAGGALGKVVATGTLSMAFKNFMRATKLKVGLASLIIAASVVTSIVVQQRANARIHELDDSLRQRGRQTADLAEDNNRLSNVLAQADRAKAELDELRRLRAEAAPLQGKAKELGALREEHNGLRQQLQSLSKTPLQKDDDQFERVKFVMNFLQAARRFEEKYGRSPSGFDEAAPFLPKDSDAATSPFRDNFEWVYQFPDMKTLPTNVDSVLAIREIDPTTGVDGKLNKEYGFLPGGTAQMFTVPSTWNGVRYNTFEQLEATPVILPRP